MKRTKLLKSEPCELPYRISDDVVAVSQILEIDNSEVLEIDMFHEGVLKARYFADKKTYACFINGGWSVYKLDNVARVCKGKTPVTNGYYYGEDAYVWNSNGDRRRAEEFLGTYSVDSYEGRINWEKRDRAVDRKRQRINDMMAAVPAVPEEAEAWIKENVFKGNFLFQQKGEKRSNYFCTACKEKGWKKKGWKHGEKVECPKCGSLATVNTRQQERTRKEPVVILQVFGNQWIERQFKAVCTWSDRGKRLELYEECRAIIPCGECRGKVWYGTYREADEFEQDFWDKNQENKRFLSSYLWPGNLKEVLPYGNLEKSGLDILAKDMKKMNVNKFITTFHQRPWMEYLAKGGMSRLVAEIVDKYGWWGNPSTVRTSANTLRDALKLDGNRVYRMKQINGGLSALEWLQYEQEKGIKISQESLQFLSDKSVGVDECRDILKELKSVNRLVNYMKKQKVAPGKITTIWRDYLRMAAAEGMDTTDDIVRLPKDLKARHDQLVNLINERKEAERIAENQEKYAKLDAEILKRLPEVKKYFWEDEEYMIIPAGKCEELIKEGRSLHHCVGAGDQYMEKMAKGKTWICFLRKKEDLDKPYYTLEIRMEDNAILQWYSEFDRRPDAATINGVLTRYKNSIKRKGICKSSKMKLENIA